AVTRPFQQTQLSADLLDRRPPRFSIGTELFANGTADGLDWRRIPVRRYERRGAFQFFCRGQLAHGLTPCINWAATRRDVAATLWNCVFAASRDSHRLDVDHATQLRTLYA